MMRSMSRRLDPGMSHYSILGVNRDATKGQIHKAYLKLAKKYHPDVNPGSNQFFQRVTEAKDVLADSDKRREYDMQFGGRNSSSSSAYTGSEGGGWKPADGWNSHSVGTQEVWTFGGRIKVDPRVQRAQQVNWKKQHEYVRQHQDNMKHQRANAHFQEMIFHRKMVWAFSRLLPFTIMPTIALAMYVFSRSQTRQVQSHIEGVNGDPAIPEGAIIYDGRGNAWAKDAHGKFHRLPDLHEK